MAEKFLWKKNGDQEMLMPHKLFAFYPLLWTAFFHAVILGLLQLMGGKTSPFTVIEKLRQ